MKTSDGIKMIFPVKRQSTVSREEFIAYWFAHHMPATIAAMGDRGWGYIGTVFDSTEDNERWDGFAQMFLQEPLANPSSGFGAKPIDSFHEKAVQPYFGWATREHIIISEGDELAVKPLTLGAPYPTSRSGFFKVVTFIPFRDSDSETLQSIWLNTRTAQVADAMRQANGFRYVVNLGVDLVQGAYLGMEEKYFHDRAAWQRFQALSSTDEILNDEAEQYFSGTEFVAIPV